MHGFGRKFFGGDFAQHYRGHVGDHHAQCRAEHDSDQRIKARGEGDGGDLGLIGHFGEKKRHHRDAENAQWGFRRGGVFGVKLVGNQHPCAHGEKRSAEYPAHGFGAQSGRSPDADAASQRVIEQRGHQNAPDDRPGFAETRSQYQRQQLRFVADFGECDDAGGNEKCFQESSCKR